MVCHAIIETTADLDKAEIINAVHRIAGVMDTDIVIVPQDKHLSDNQKDGVRCGDNGILRYASDTGATGTSNIARDIYGRCPYDGKYIADGVRLIICQSNVETADLKMLYPGAEINPLATGPAAST